MKYPLVRFVAAPEVDAEVRFDFNAAGTWADEDVWADHEGFDLGVPTLEGDPDSVGVEYGFREMSFSLVIRGSKSAALQAQSALARELLRRENWLLFQLDDSTAPVWFKTYRTQPGELSFEHVYTDGPTDVWGIAVNLTADPFAYGERVTLPTATINNDPAATSNPMSVVLPEILGDAPAPLRAAVIPSATNTNATVRLSRAGSAATYWPVGAGDAWTADADTGVPVSNAAYSGGSYRPVTFATVPGLGTRLRGAYPTVPAAGRYTILVRVARSDTSSQFSLQAQQSVGLTTVNGPPANFAPKSGGSANWASWVNLGEFAIPLGIADFDTADDIAPAGGTFYFRAGRTSGTGELRIDGFLLVPTMLLGDGGESRTMYADFSYTPLGLLGGMRHTWDGDSETYRMVYDAGAKEGQAADTLPPMPAGDFLHVLPGRPNVVHVMQQTGGFSPLGGSDSISATASLRLSYQPRYLYLGGV